MNEKVVKNPTYLIVLFSFISNALTVAMMNPITTETKIEMIIPTTISFLVKPRMSARKQIILTNSRLNLTGLVNF